MSESGQNPARLACAVSISSAPRTDPHCGIAANSPLYGAKFVKGVPRGAYPFSLPFLCSTWQPVSSPRPTHPRRRRAQQRSRLAAPSGGHDRLGLDGSEHDGTLAVVGMTKFEGGSPRVRSAYVAACKAQGIRVEGTDVFGQAAKAFADAACIRTLASAGKVYWCGVQLVDAPKRLGPMARRAKT
jgi:hypothetical protein